ncbi:transporter [Persephonella sp.]
MKKFAGILLTSSIFLLSNAVASDQDIERAKKALQKEAQPEEVLIQFERDYVLLQKNKLEVESSFSYVYYSANQIYLSSFAILDPVFLTLGEFGIKNARRHIFQYNISLRYGILRNLQFELSIPFVYRNERTSVIGTSTTGEKENISEERGFGDLSLSFSYQPIRETGTRPALITFLAFKTKTGKSPFDLDDPEKDLPTGSGYYAIRGGINLTKTIDPVVVFGGISYSYNMEEDVKKFYKSPTTGEVSRLDKINPGDTLSLSFGFAYALSYNFSLNFQYAQDYTFSTESTVNGIKSTVPNSTLNSAILRIGTGWAISDRSSFNCSLSIGLTNDAPNYIIEFRYPYRF